MTSITINGNTVKSDEIPDHVPQTAQGTNFILVQGRYRDFNANEKKELADLKVEIQEYVAEHTYLCRYMPKDLDPIRAKPYVKNVTIYLREFKTTLSLKDTVERDENRTNYEIDCILHDNPNVNARDLAPHIATAAGADIKKLEICPSRIRLTVHQDKLQELVKLDSVNRIEEVRPDELFNDQARGTLNADMLALSTAYQGAGQRICVADTGFDQGKISDEPPIEVHPAFAGSLEHLDFLYPDEKYADPRDPVGHGTHVCASICGSGIYKHPELGNISVRGTAPSAKLMVQSISKWDTDWKKWIIKVPVDLFRDLFSKPYGLGVRIHSNSWSKAWDETSGQIDYEAQATDIDRFIYENPDFTILVAAGNHADKTKKWGSQIGAASAAKNAITVGATGSSRANDGQRFVGIPGAKPVTKVNDTAIFSSRGPTKPSLDKDGKPFSGRIKPDIVAPGVAILSAASRAVSKYDAVRTRFGPSADIDWLFMSGTSMPTPLVAGCVALLREALQRHGKQHPSSSLIKSLLVNGAVNYSEACGLGLGYDYEQGFGRVDVDSSIAMIAASSFIEGGSLLEATQFDVSALRQIPETEKRWASAEIPVPSGRNRLVVTLAYPDPPGSLLQNDLNLIVLSAGAERHGNMGKGKEFDHINNVEKVIWDNVPGASFKIVVRVSNNVKPESRATFAVAWDIRAMAKI
ncbi:serine racemase [Colletotrichum spaethianum]|uniref:Serine racemase n=1 Tax=Colletotrichum spaethianum TaxID=700344 RepID=A0AA37LA73_9PEZI|nr:serine racemase [Colletotrichum spaethianum]GKT42870.1 serine racemase [Colletotrichum spaethianum]